MLDLFGQVSVGTDENWLCVLCGDTPWSITVVAALECEHNYAMLTVRNECNSLGRVSVVKLVQS